MIWSCETVEHVMNYLRVVKGATDIFEFSLDNDIIGYHVGADKATVRFFSSIVKEMLDNGYEV